MPITAEEIMKNWPRGRVVTPLAACPYCDQSGSVNGRPCPCCLQYRNINTESPS